MSLPPSQRSKNSGIDLTLVEEISRSILTNLDRDGLLNSIVSLFHQVFGFTRVTLVTLRGENKKHLKKIGISIDGLQPETLYQLHPDSSPLDWSITHAETLVINDTGRDNRFSPTAFDNFVQSELVIPLLRDDILAGVLELGADAADVFIPETVQVFSSLAEKITIAIGNAEQYHAEQLRRLVNERVQEIAGSLSADTPNAGLIDDLLDELQRFVTCDASALWLVDNAADDSGISQFLTSFQLAGLVCKDQISKDLFRPYLQNTANSAELFEKYPWINECIDSKMAGIRDEAALFEPLGGILGYEQTYSALSVPLMIADRLLGVLICAHHLPGQYDEEELSIASRFAAQSSVVIENERLYRAAHDQAWISTVLLQVNEATQSITSLDDLLGTLVRILPGLLDVDACAIFLWNPSVEIFEGCVSGGFDDDQAARLSAWNILPGSVLAFEVMTETKSPVIFDKNNIPSEDAAAVFPGFDFDKDLLILFPLLTQNYLCGAILVDFSDSELAYNSSQQVWDEKYTLIQGAANQAAFAIENLQLIKSQEEEAYISVALLQVAQAVVSLKELDEILGTIVRITPILVGVKRCIIYLWDAKDQVFRQSQSFGFTKNDLAVLGQVIKANEFSLIEAVQQSDQIIFRSLSPADSPASWNDANLNDLHVIKTNESGSEDEISIKLDESMFSARERMLMGFPLSVKTELLGAMLIEEEDSTKGLPSLHIREKRIEIVKGITQQAAIAIKNELLQQEAVKSERMERELQLAREIQATFLPEKLPEFPGWEIDARWQPARQVGGDFYDLISLGENRLGFVIADVADKGMPAALFMTLIRTLLRAAAKEKKSPAEVLQQVNELLIPDAKQGMFVTVFYGLLSLDTGLLSYANAGHNPPLLKLFQKKEVIELTRTAIALGLFEVIDVEQREIHLHPGDWLLLYTDGITEAFSPADEMYGTHRLIQIFSAGDYTSSSQLLNGISDSVNDFIRGTDLSDDMTMMVIHKIP